MRSRCTWPPGLAYDAGGQIAAGMWMGALGSAAFYSAATVDNAPVLVAAELVAGNAMLNPVWDPSSPGLLLLVGTNPVVSHGYGTTLPDPIRYLREYRGDGGRVWVLDPRRTETAATADEHVAVRPGADVAVLGALVADLLDRPGVTIADCTSVDLDILREAVAPFTMERAAREAGVDVAALQRLAAEVREHHGRLAVFCGTGLTMARDGVVAEWLRWVLLILTESLDRPGGMRFNRGAVNRLRPPRTSTSSRPAPSGPREPARAAPGGQPGARASRSPTRSTPGTSACWSSPAATRSPRSPIPTGLRRSLARLDALGRGRRGRQRAVRDSPPTCSPRPASSNAPTSRSPSTCALRSGLQSTRPVVAAGRRAQAGVVDARVARPAARLRHPRRRRSRRARRRDLPRRRARPLGSSPGSTCSAPVRTVWTYRSSTAGCARRCCSTARGTSPRR